MPNHSALEAVHVENAWWDGPRAGIADIAGQPHRFVASSDIDAPEVIFHIWPISPEELLLEQEQWQIFVRWNVLYEAGLANTGTHPGHGGVDSRWDVLQAQLAQARSQIPVDAVRATAELHWLERGERYTDSGPDYALIWTLL